MGACVRIPGIALSVSIKLPGGLDLSSMSGQGQGIPNCIDPFQSLLSGVQPVLGSIKPVFDIIGFVMALMDVLIKTMQLLSALSMIVAPGNPLTLLFPPDPLLDADGVVIQPEIPDLASMIPNLINSLAGVVCEALKLGGLIPQLSAVFTIKDTIIAALQFGDCAMAQFNSLIDSFGNLPAANFGFPHIDILLQCAQDNSLPQLEAKIGPLTNLVPLMSIVSLIAEIAARPLPKPLATMAKLMAGLPPTGFGLLPFPDLSGVGGPTSDEQREQFLALIDDMATTGLPFAIPDFSNLSDVATTLNELRASLDPIIPIIELVQQIVDKITKC